MRPDIHDTVVPCGEINLLGPNFLDIINLGKIADRGSQVKLNIRVRYVEYGKISGVDGVCFPDNDLVVCNNLGIICGILVDIYQLLITD